MKSYEQWKDDFTRSSNILPVDIGEEAQCLGTDNGRLTCVDVGVFLCFTFLREPASKTIRRE